jgi:phosphoribosyl-AMP cyclohydrolase
MATSSFKDRENCNEGSRFPLDELLGQLCFNEAGLLPVIAQQHDTGEVLMLAWMNREAIHKTLDSGMVTYWSRSRQCYWTKGLTSGNLQHLIEMKFDCDGDAILCFVDQKGPACHTNRNNCFYYSVDPKNSSVILRSEGFSAK